MSRLVDALDDRINPILVKEMRQGLRSRWLSVGVLIALGGLLAGYPLVAAMMSPMGSSGDAGSAFFSLTMSATVLLSWLFLPISASRQLAGEIASRTLELTQLTRLTAWQSISGRFQANLVKLALLCSFAGPFAVASALLGGVGLDRMLGSFFGVLMVAIVAQSLGLLTGAVAVHGRRASGALSLALFFALLFGGTGSFALIWEPRILSSMHWEGLFVVAALAAATTAFCLRLAADLVLPPSARSFAASKIVLFACVVLACAPTWFDERIVGDLADEEYAIGVVALGLVEALVVGAFWSASRPLARRAPRRGRLLGALSFPLQNGYAATCWYLFSLTLILSTATGVHGLPPVGLFGFGYFLAYTGPSRLLSEVLVPADVRPAGYLLLLLGLLVLGAFVPAVAPDVDPRVSAVEAFFPVVVVDRYDQLEAPAVLALPALFGLAAATVARALARSRAAAEERGG